MNIPEYYITRNADKIDLENMRKWDTRKLAEEYLNLTKHTLTGYHKGSALNMRNMIAGILVLERNIESIAVLPGFDPIIIKQHTAAINDYRTTNLKK